jgi:hypothetical protein
MQSTNLKIKRPDLDEDILGLDAAPSGGNISKKQTRKEFDRRRFVWNDRIMLDPSISDLKHRVAVLISNKYLNFTKGYAWPKQKDMAAKLGLGIRTIQCALDALVDAGHLGREVAHGRGRNNRYWPIFDTENVQEGDIKPAPPCTFTDDDDSKTCTATPENLHGDDIKPAPPFVHNPLTNPCNNPKERGPTRPQIIGKKGQTSWPEGFKLTPDLIGYAERKKFTRFKADNMFEEFKNNSLANGKTFSDWDSAWKSWVDKQNRFTPPEEVRNTGF